MRVDQSLRIAALWFLLLLSAQAAEEADALPTLFDFLGAMETGSEGQWVDPLDMEGIEELSSPTDATVPDPHTEADPVGGKVAGDVAAEEDAP